MYNIVTLYKYRDINNKNCYKVAHNEDKIFRILLDTDFSKDRYACIAHVRMS